jgi:hypothetical protein
MADDAESSPEPQPPSPPVEPPQEERRGFRFKPSSVIGQVATVVGLIASVLGIVVLVAPDLLPDPSPTERSATISKLTLQERVRFRSYLQRVDLPSDGYTKAKLEQLGVFLQFGVQTKGYKDEQLPLKWELFDAVTNDQVGEERGRIVLEPEANDDRASWHAWVPVPRGKGRYYVRLELLDEDAVPLDFAQTKVFTGLGA